MNKKSLHFESFVEEQHSCQFVNYELNKRTGPSFIKFLKISSLLNPKDFILKFQTHLIIRGGNKKNWHFYFRMIVVSEKILGI